MGAHGGLIADECVCACFISPQRQYNGDIVVDKSSSYYVGGSFLTWFHPYLQKHLIFHYANETVDAAGRPRDHSDSDKAYAANVGVKFYTESEFFKQLHA